MIIIKPNVMFTFQQSKTQLRHDVIQKYIPQELGKVDVCINNAGMSTSETLLDGKYENWKKMMNINVIGTN